MIRESSAQSVVVTGWSVESADEANQHVQDKELEVKTQYKTTEPPPTQKKQNKKILEKINITQKNWGKNTTRNNLGKNTTQNNWQGKSTKQLR